MPLRLRTTIFLHYLTQQPTVYPGSPLATDLNTVASTTECTLEVNPLTKKIYVLANSNVYTVEKDPSDKLSLAALDMSAVKGVKLDYALPTTSAKTVKDFDYAEDENRIYLSVGIGDANLNGIITWMEAPFNEGDNWTVYRATSFLTGSSYVWMLMI